MSTFITDRIGEVAEVIPIGTGKYALIHPRQSRATIVLASLLMHILSSGGFLTHEDGVEC